MVNIKKIIFNSFQVNTYIIYDESKDCIIVDPACYGKEENDRLVKFLSDNNLSPILSMNTHCHIDHILGIDFVKNQFDIPSYAHKLELEILKNAPIMADIFGFEIKDAPETDKYISSGEIIKFGESEIQAIHVPGHSPGSLAYYSEKGKFLVSGDALFEGSIGRTDLPGGDYDTLIKSITNNLFSLPEDVIIYPGHGNHSTIENEKKYNPFFNDSKT